MIPVIAIEIAFHDSTQALAGAIKSALEQKVSGYFVGIVVLDSSPNWCASEILRDSGLSSDVKVFRSNAKNAYTARNRLLRYAEKCWPRLAWHVRLDADDRLTCRNSISKSLKLVKPTHRIILAGNRQIGNGGRVLGRNIPTRLLINRGRLMERLMGMAQGDFKAELPSCNLILRAGFKWRYPRRRSAEDHWLVAMLLLKSRPEWVYVRSVEMVDYFVGGLVTKQNKKNEMYLSQRVKLLEAAAGWQRCG